MQTDKYGLVTLVNIGNGTNQAFEVYDSEVDTYYGTIHECPKDSQHLEKLLGELRE